MVWRHPKPVTVIWTRVSTYELEAGRAFGKLTLAVLVLRGSPRESTRCHLLVEKWPVALQKSLTSIIATHYI